MATDWHPSYHVLIFPGMRSSPNGISEKDEFNNLLEFKTKLIPYKGNDSWVEPTLTEVKETLMQDSPPEADSKCSYCAYVKKTLLI